MNPVTDNPMIHRIELIRKKGHLFVNLENELFLIDTGAPKSFGKTPSIKLLEEDFKLPTDSLGLSAGTLSGYVGLETAGLLGTDILNHFDILFDEKGHQLSISRGELEGVGESLVLDEFMGIPILAAGIAERSARMFFDTGAQISYYQGDALSDFPAMGSVEDFYPGIGQFSTETHRVPIKLGSTDFNLCCGKLPPLLGLTLMMAETEGIIGNEIMRERRVVYLPRRKRLFLS